MSLAQAFVNSLVCLYRGYAMLVRCLWILCCEGALSDKELCLGGGWVVGNTPVILNVIPSPKSSRFFYHYFHILPLPLLLELWSPRK